MTQIIEPSFMKKQTVKQNSLTINLTDHKFDESGMPIYLMSLIETMRKYPEMMAMEGIFRKAGSI